MKKLIRDFSPILWVFGIFFLVAGICIALDTHYGWHRAQVWLDREDWFGTK